MRSRGRRVKICDRVVSLVHCQMTKFKISLPGASGTIGSGTAEAFARLGAKLALTGRSADKLAQTAKKCEAAGAPAANIFTITGDITKGQDVENIVSKSVAKFSGIDILVRRCWLHLYRSINSFTSP